MFTSVKIESYRSCVNVELSDLPYLTALIGRNGAGKTNILQAIRWLTATATGERPAARSSQFHDQSVSATIQLSDSLFDYRVAVEYEPNSDGSISTKLTESVRSDDFTIERSGQDVNLSFHDDSLRISGETPCMPAITALFPDIPQVEHLTRLMSFLSSVHYYALDEPHYPNSPRWSLISENAYKQWISGIEKGAIGIDVPLRLLHMHKARRESFDEVLSLLGEDGVDLIKHIEISQMGSSSSSDSESYYWLGFVPTAQPNLPVNFLDLSAGTRRAVNLIVSLIYDHSAVMLVEHPEDSIHSALLTKLLSIMRVNCDPAQVIMTTHATEVFDLLETNEVRLVSMDKERTSVRSLSEQEVEAACQFIRHDGSFSDFLETVQDD